MVHKFFKKNMITKEILGTNACKQNPCCSLLCNKPSLESTKEASSSNVGEVQSTNSSLKFNIGEEPHSSSDKDINNFE